MKLDRSDLKNHPMDQFQEWFDTAKQDSRIKQPNAMAVATVDADGYPNNRYVLMKHHDQEGLIFYTNLGSQKGRALIENAKVAATFYWEPLRRSVRFQGNTSLISDTRANMYFSSRERGSQLGAWASKQSQHLETRKKLEERYEKYRTKFQNKEVPRPEFWSGFRIKPHKVEFWQSRANRLHDRFVYSLTDDKWIIERLYP